MGVMMMMCVCEGGGGGGAVKSYGRLHCYTQ